jgi:FkbM family methyltransferase
MSAPLHTLDWTVWEWCLLNCEPKVALDIGANIGGFSEQMLGAGFYVYAFEPVPDQFEKLFGKLGLNANFCPYNIGLSDKASKEAMTVVNAWTLGTPETTGFGVNQAYVETPLFNVNFVRLDDMPWPEKIGLIKLDVDGYEPKVWRGGKKLIERDRPPILCELNGYVVNCGESIEAFINDILSMRYWLVSTKGNVRYSSWEQVKRDYPYNSSYDVMLIPEEMLHRIP